MDRALIPVSRYWRSLMGPQPLRAVESYPAYWLKVAHDRISGQFAKRLREEGMSPAEWAVLRELYRPEWLSPVVLARLTGISKGAASKLVDRLAEKGLARKLPSEWDARFRGVQLTSRGATVVLRLVQVEDDADRKFFGALSEERRERLVQILKDICLRPMG